MLVDRHSSTVRLVGLINAEVNTSLGVAEPYSMESGSSIPRPGLSASGDRLVVADPAKATVHVIDVLKMQVSHKVTVPGAPFDAALVSATGKDH